MPKVPTKKSEAPKKAPIKKPMNETTISQERKSPSGRDIVYPQVKVTLRAGANPMNQEDAKKILGWTEVDKEPLFTDLNGKKIACSNNVGNRPFSRANADTVQQQVLRKRWKLNGETMILGESGLCLSVQHRLIGFILACQEWSLHPDKWPLWTTEPTMDCILVFGISEDDETVNTLDTGKTRSLTDVIYRSEYFKGMPSKDRKQVARLCDYAVRLLWHRTGAQDAFAPRRTHAESLDFINKHPRILECVKHIFEENGEGEDGNKIGKWLSPGCASAMLYLMGCAKSNSKDYYTADQRSESLLTWDFDTAADFWSLLAGGSKELNAVQVAIKKLLQEGAGSLNERLAIICKAWHSKLKHGTVRLNDLSLSYSTFEDVKTLIDAPTVGGIDRGDPGETDTEDDDEGVQERAALERKAKNDSTADHAMTNVVWVKEENNNHWHGELLKRYAGLRGEVCSIKVSPGFAGAGNQIEVPAAKVQATQPGLITQGE